MKKIKILFCILLTLTTVLSIQKINDSYAIDNTIHYDGKKKTFVFNGDNLDLFDELKELMPGDKKEQIIKVNINNVNHDIDMYVKLINENDIILDKLNMKLYKNEKLIFNNDKYNKFINIYSDDASDSFDLKLVVEVPKELGNELVGLTNNFRWTFMVEDYGKNIDISNPNTSVGANIYFYYVLLFISLFAIIVLIISMVKDKKTRIKI